MDSGLFIFLVKSLNVTVGQAFKASGMVKNLVLTPKITKIYSFLFPEVIFSSFSNKPQTWQKILSLSNSENKFVNFVKYKPLVCVKISLFI